MTSESLYYPDRAKFHELARQGNAIPVTREFLLDVETPVAALFKLRKGRYAFLLESVEHDELVGRYSFVGTDPAMVMELRGSRVTIRRRGERLKRRTLKAGEHPLSPLREVLADIRCVEVEGLPRFAGGFVGYVGYDVVRHFERIPDNNPDELGVPDAVFMLADQLVIFDHHLRKLQVVTVAMLANDTAEEIDRAYDQAIGRCEQWVKKLETRQRRHCTLTHPHRAPEPTIPPSDVTQEEFEDRVHRVKQLISDGEIIQAVISQRFRQPIKCQPLDVFRALRSINPSPYMYYLQCGNLSVVGASPEVMVRCENDQLEVRPIAGTRPRGKTAEADADYAATLLADPKERAEHIMLVDLGRNDLGRVARIGSVKVTELMAIERYSHVMHIVSNCTATLDAGRDMLDVIQATFPAGTVTGAPKIRAMEIIDDVETHRRGPYAGMVGYISLSGNLDSCITIRTILIKDGIAYVQAGAGIVADSDPASEYQETVNKARAMLAAIALAESTL